MSETTLSFPEPMPSTPTPPKLRGKAKPGSKRQAYGTPASILELVFSLNGERSIDLDPCAMEDRTFALMNLFEGETDGLSADWRLMCANSCTVDGRPPLVYVNPPYGGGEIAKWVAKGIEESAWDGGLALVFLLPASTETQWFRELVHHGAHICFLNKRVTFVGQKNPYPGPHLIAALGVDWETFSDVLGDVGVCF